MFDNFFIDKFEIILSVVCRASLSLSNVPNKNSTSKIDGLDRFWTPKTWISQEGAIY